MSPAGGQWTAEMAETAKAMYLTTLQRSIPVANDNEYGKDDMLPSLNRYMDGARYGEQYGDQLEESDVDPNLDDDVVEIKHGSPLRKRRMEEIDTDEKGCKKRRRFRISDLPEDEKPLWSMFLEAVRLDYVQKGPDNPAPEGETRGRKRLADNRELISMIKRRHRMMFGEDARPLAKREIEGVSTYQRAYDDFLGETAY